MKKAREGSSFALCKFWKCHKILRCGMKIEIFFQVKNILAKIIPFIPQ